MESTEITADSVSGHVELEQGHDEQDCGLYPRCLPLLVVPPDVNIPPQQNLRCAATRTSCLVGLLSN